MTLRALLLPALAFVIVSTGLVSAAEIAVLERGPHHRVVRETRQWVREDGTVEETQSTVTELRNGMHYQRNGAWVLPPLPFIIPVKC